MISNFKISDVKDTKILRGCFAYRRRGSKPRRRLTADVSLKFEILKFPSAKVNTERVFACQKTFKMIFLILTKRKRAIF